MLDWVLVSHFLVVLGFLLCAVIVAQILVDQRRHPRAVAWLLLIVLLPYAGVPLYLLFGGRKIQALASSKRSLDLVGEQPVPAAEASPIDRLLRSFEIPGATRGNRVEIFADGVASYHGLMKLIDEASDSIQVVTYLLRHDPIGRLIVDRLTEKARAGVVVELLLDGIGSLLVNRKVLRPLEQAGGKVDMFIPLLHSPLRGRANLRNHRKMVIVDGEKVWSGGANFGREYLAPEDSRDLWKDLTFLLEGPAVRQFSEIFQSDWHFATSSETAAPPRLVPPVVPPEESAWVQVVPSGPDIKGDAFHNALLSAAFMSQERLWIVTPYFVPDDALLEALSIAGRRGIDLRVLVPRHSNHRLADIARGPALREIQAAGAKVFLYDGGMLHAKATVMDDHLATIGTANVDSRSLFLNFECTTFFYSRPEIERTAAWFEDLLGGSRRGIAEAGRLKSLWEGLVRLMSPLL